MRRLVFCTLALVFALTGCKKDIEQLPFTLKNLSTLIEKSSDYITQASPGTVDETDAGYMYFLLNDAIEGISTLHLYYDLEEDLCDFILVYSDVANRLADAQALIELSESELGAGVYYYLGYYDDESVLQEEEFADYDEMQTFIADSSLVVADIDEMMVIYHEGEFYYMSGGYYSESNSYFMSLIEIGFWDALAMVPEDQNSIVKSSEKNRRHEMPLK